MTQYGIKFPALQKHLNGGALLLIMFFWGLHLGYPMHRLQHARLMFMGYFVPLYYLLTVLFLVGAAAVVLTLKRHWSKWEVLWWLLPLICLPGILNSSDHLWSVRQWLSWIIRGVIPGGIIFLTAQRKDIDLTFRYWIYPIVIAASLVGLTELYNGFNPLWEGVDNHISQTSQPDNPLYRPYDTMVLSVRPQGTQGNRIPYAATLIGFWPLGLWLFKYTKRLRWVQLIFVGALSSILLLAQVRSVWVAALAAFILMSAVGLQRNRRETIKISAGVLLCLGLFWVWPKTHEILRARLSSFNITEVSIRDRLGALRTAKVIKDLWVLGVGFGQFPKFKTPSSPYAPGVVLWSNTPDNQYVRWAVENGLPSLIIMTTFFIGLIRAGWKKVRLIQDVQRADFYKSVLVGWLSIVVTFLFFDGFYWGACNMTFWCLLGLFATCLRLDESSAC